MFVFKSSLYQLCLLGSPQTHVHPACRLTWKWVCGDVTTARSHQIGVGPRTSALTKRGEGARRRTQGRRPGKGGGKGRAAPSRGCRSCRSWRGVGGPPGAPGSADTSSADFWSLDREGKFALSHPVVIHGSPWSYYTYTGSQRFFFSFFP